MQILQWLLLVFSLALPLGAAQAQEPTLISHIGRGAIDSVQWHPDGSYIMVTTVTGTWLYTPDLKDLAYIPAYFAQMSSDGRYIAGLDEDHYFSLWDAKTYEEVESYSSFPMRYVNVLKWSPNSQSVVVSGDGFDYPLTITGQISADYSFSIFVGKYNDIDWSPQGRYLARLSEETVSILDTVELKVVLDYRLGSERSMIWDDETHILVIWPGEGADVKRLNILTAGEEPRDSNWAYGTTYNHQRDTAAFQNIGSVGFGNPTNNIMYKETVLPGSTWISNMAWNHADSLLAVGSYSATITLVDAKNGQVVQQLSGFTQSLQHIVWSPDDRFLIAVDAYQNIVLYETKSWTVSSRSLKHTDVGETLAWNPDASQLAIADTLGYVALWDVEQGEKKQKSTLFKLPITTIKWQPDGDLIGILAYDENHSPSGDFQIWNPEDDVYRNRLDSLREKISQPIQTFDWTSTGQDLAILAGTTLYLWHPVSTATEIIPLTPTTWSTNIIWSVQDRFIAFLSDHRYASSSYIYTTSSKASAILQADTYYGIGTWTSDDVWMALEWGNPGDPGDTHYLRPRLSRFMPPFNGIPLTNVPDILSVSATSSDELIGLTTNATQGFLSPQGRYAAAVDTNNAGMIWDAETAKPLSMLTDTANIVWSPDETHAIIQRTDGTVWILTGEGQILAQIPTLVSTQKPSGTFFWSPDSHQVAYLHDGVVETWRIGI